MAVVIVLAQAVETAARDLRFHPLTILWVAAVLADIAVMAVLAVTLPEVVLVLAEEVEAVALGSTLPDQILPLAAAEEVASVYMERAQVVAVGRT
jgi:hypothetical protein